MCRFGLNTGANRIGYLMAGIKFITILPLKNMRNTTLPKLLKKAQTVFNRFIRNRDQDLPCICCGSYKTSDAGHYYSQGHHSALRFNEVNVNLCCRKCNSFLSGNLIHYRNGLIKKYTQQQIDLLDSVGTRSPVKKWSRVELEQIILRYQIS